MSYQPTLIIKYSDLKNIQSELEVEQFSPDYEDRKVAELLLELFKCENIRPEFEGTKIAVITPAFTLLNSLVRERLDEGNIYYIKIE